LGDKSGSSLLYQSGRRISPEADLIIPYQRFSNTLRGFTSFSHNSCKIQINEGKILRVGSEQSEIDAENKIIQKEIEAVVFYQRYIT
jgi:hypothetical protein